MRQKGVRESWLEREDEGLGCKRQSGKEKRKVRMRETCHPWRVVNQLTIFISLFSVSKKYNVAIKSKSLLIDCLD